MRDYYLNKLLICKTLEYISWVNSVKGCRLFGIAQTLTTFQHIYKSVSVFIILLVLLLGASLDGVGQTTIWSEDFESYSDGTEVGQGTPFITSWTADGVTSGRGVNVQLDRLQGYRTKGAGGRENWTIDASNPIEISGYSNVNVSVDLTSGINLDANDYIYVRYSLDGNTTWTEFSGSPFSGNMGTPTIATVAGLTGNTLRLQIQMLNNNNEYYYVDNILVQGTLITSPPSCSATPSPSDVSIDFSVNGTLSWDASPEATGYKIYFGTDAGATNIENGTDLGNTTSYTPAGNLNSLSTYYWRIVPYSAYGDAIGCSIWSFTTECSAISILPFTEDFSSGSLPACWQNIDNQGSGQKWQFQGNPIASPYVNFTFASTTADNGFVLLNSDGYGSGSSQNADLVSPTFDFTNYSEVTLNFDHAFVAWSGSSGTLEYSINGGSSWIPIDEWISSTGDNPTIFSEIIPGAAGESDVKFKWNYTGSWGYYWAIDDINITGTQACTAPDIPTLSVSISTICDGESTTLSIASGNLNDADHWQWYSGSCGGTAVGQDTSIIVSPSVTTTYYARGEGTCDGSTCGSLTINVNSSTSIYSQPSTTEQTYCQNSASAALSITASGTSLSYQWYSNASSSNSGGSLISGASADSYTPLTTTSGTLYYYCVVSGTCGTETSDASGAIIIEDGSPILVSISANPSGTVCDGTTVVYTATPSNGGTAPSYQWKINGTNVGTDSDSYSYEPIDGDEISCVLTSNSACATSAASVPFLFFSWDDDSKSITDSDFGLDAISVDAGAQYISNSLAPGSASSGTQGVDLTFSGAEPELNFEGIEYSIDYRRGEGQAEMFTRGSYLIITSGSDFSVSYRISDGVGSFTTVTSGNIYTIPSDDTFHNYRFLYNPQDGIGRLIVDEDEKWQSTATPGQPLYWDGASSDNLLVGKFVDASGTQVPTFDNLSIKAINEKTANDTFAAVVEPLIEPTLSSNSPVCSGGNAVFTITGAAGNIVTYTGASGSPLSPATIGTGGTVDVTVSGVTSNTTLNLTNVSDGSCNLTLTGISETIKVNPLPVSPTAVNTTTTYDGNVHSASASPGSGETIAWYTAASGGSSTVAPTATIVGSYSAWAEARNTTTGCVSSIRTQVTLTINQAALTITAEDNSKEYDGMVFSPFTVSYSGFATGDDENDLNGSLSFSGTATSATNVGTGYVIIPAGFTSSNYAITFVDGTLDITTRPVTVTADDLSKVCGYTDPALTYQITSGSLVSGDSFTGSLLRAAGETTGDYTITQRTLDLSSNYNLTFIEGTFSIDDPEAPTVICPDDQEENFDLNCEFTLPDYTSLATVGDNCDATPTVTQSPAIGTKITANTTITLIVTDASGNSNSCTFDITLVPMEEIDIKVEPLSNSCQDGETSSTTTIIWDITKLTGTDDWQYDYTINDGSSDIETGSNVTATGDIQISYTFSNENGVDKTYTLTLNNVKDNCGISETEIINNSDTVTLYGLPNTGEIIPD